MREESKLLEESVKVSQDGMLNDSNQGLNEAYILNKSLEKGQDVLKSAKYTQQKQTEKEVPTEKAAVDKIEG